MKRLPNALTLLRMALSCVLLFLQPIGWIFWSVYALCGLTDAADGYLARRLDAASKLGEKLDSAADVLFLTAAMVKLLPTWPLQRWMLLCAAGIVLLRSCAALVGRLRLHQWLFLHTRLNKATGIALFLLPLAALVLPFTACIAAACLLAGLAAIEELVLLSTKMYIGKKI